MDSRLSELQSAYSITTPDTKTIDLDYNEIFSRISLQVRLTNNGGTPTGVPIKAIKKIEIIDGSEVLFGLSGQQLQARNFYNGMDQPLQTLNYWDNVQSIATAHIYFGRYLWDREYGFDPSRFNNPQLKITHDYSLGGAAPDAATLQVVADTFDRAALSLKGFLTVKNYYQYTLTDSGVEEIDLPQDFPLLAAYIQSQSTTKQPYEQYHDLKIVEGNDTRILLNMSVSNLIKFIGRNRRMWKENVFAALTTGGVTVYVSPTYEVGIGGSSTDNAASYIEGAQSTGGQASLQASANTNAQLQVQGYLPHGMMHVPFSAQPDLSDAYDTSRVTKPKMKITAGSSVGASSECTVLVEQVRQ